LAKITLLNLSLLSSYRVVTALKDFFKIVINQTPTKQKTPISKYVTENGKSKESFFYE
jgi:hypothetical protein